MKSLLVFALFALVSVTAHASDYDSLVGEPAVQLFELLEKTGSQGDSGVGHLGIGASEILCQRTKFPQERSRCSLKSQTMEGSPSRPHSIKGRLAQALTDLLIDAGVVSCGMENCFGQTREVQCELPTDPSAPVSESRCVFQ